LGEAQPKALFQSVPAGAVAIGGFKAGTLKNWLQRALS